MATNNRSAPPINADTPYSELPELLTAQELAAYRRSTVWSVYDQCRRKVLPSVRHGRLVRIPKFIVNSPTK
jgi:hypothetical protein